MQLIYTSAEALERQLSPELFQVVEENDEDENLLELPPHAAFLYKLLGSDRAEEFLHPAMDEAELKGPHSQTSRLPRRQNGLSREMHNLSQHATSAERLWKVLREDSQAEMDRIEARSYTMLRDSYESFVRQCILKREIPTLLKDLKSHEWHAFRRLLEKSEINQINEERRKNELMFRVARGNEAKYQILSYNNPLPDLVDRQGKLSINRFFPLDCIPQAHNNQVVSSHKHGTLTPIYEGLKRRANRPESQSTPALIGRLGLSTAVDGEALRRKKTPPQHLQQSYRFLRESDCREPGQFRDLMSGPLMSKDPMKKMLRDSEQARSHHEKRLSESRDRMKETKDSLPVVSPRLLHDRKKTHWPPLSLSSLLDYSRTKSFLFPKKNGEFREGRVPVWRHNESLNLDT